MRMHKPIVGSDRLGGVQTPEHGIRIGATLPLCRLSVDNACTLRADVPANGCGARLRQFHGYACDAAAAMMVRRMTASSTGTL
jgi:hypothetical protein